MKHITENQISEMEKFYRTTFINSLPGYRSLHLVGTVSNDGKTNLALFNSVFHVGANPPLLGMVCRPDTPDHDTLKNIIATGEYTLNTVSADWYEQAHQTSASYPSGISEFDEIGLTPICLNDFAPPFVRESVIQIGLKLKETIGITNGTTIVIGEIVNINIDENTIGKDGYVDHISAATVSVAGLDSYFIGNPLGRLAYPKPGKPTAMLNTDQL